MAATYKKYIACFLSNPSAIFDEIEIDALLICLTKSKFFKFFTIGYFINPFVENP
jgi:hypothetical protein